MIGRRKAAIDIVHELLETQKAALLQGDLQALAGIETRLERALGQLKEQRAEQADLVRVQALAARNATLLTAAQKGVATARVQLESRASSGLSTYDAAGQSHTTTTQQARLLARR